MVPSQQERGGAQSMKIAACILALTALARGQEAARAAIAPATFVPLFTIS